MTSHTTSSNSWKNSKNEQSPATVNNGRLNVEDLSSVIGLMAYGDLRKDINKNVRRRYDKIGFYRY